MVWFGEMLNKIIFLAHQILKHILLIQHTSATYDVNVDKDQIYLANTFHDIVSQFDQVKIVQ